MTFAKLWFVFLLFGTVPAWSRQDERGRPDEFIFGASIYPELLTNEQQLELLEILKAAHCNVVRVADSSWGNLEVAPGRYDFGWLITFLDNAHQAGFKTILGTGTYIAPQWLTAEHPEVLVQNRPGVWVHSMLRKAACLHHPRYRQAVWNYIRALAAATKDHPSVTAWQLDNEIEFILPRLCHNKSCVDAWHRWLEAQYGRVDSLNLELGLQGWGLEVRDFKSVSLPTHSQLKALNLAALRFRRDTILDFLKEQVRLLRQSGVTDEISTDWNLTWLGVSDDPVAEDLLDFSGVNVYHAEGHNTTWWKEVNWQLDRHRSAHDDGHYLVMKPRSVMSAQAASSAPFPPSSCSSCGHCTPSPLAPVVWSTGPGISGMGGIGPIGGASSTGKDQRRLVTLGFFAGVVSFIGGAIICYGTASAQVQPS